MEGNYILNNLNLHFFKEFNLYLGGEIKFKANSYDLSHAYVNVLFWYWLFPQHLKTQNFRLKYVFGKNLKFETFQHDGQYIIKN